MASPDYGLWLRQTTRQLVNETSLPLIPPKGGKIKPPLGGWGLFKSCGLVFCETLAKHQRERRRCKPNDPTTPKYTPYKGVYRGEVGLTTAKLCFLRLRCRFARPLVHETTSPSKPSLVVSLTCCLVVFEKKVESRNCLLSFVLCLLSFF